MKFNVLNTIKNNYSRYGLRGVWNLFKSRLVHVKRKPIASFSNYVELFKEKRGLELGGPSPIFNIEIPIYPLVDDLHGCNFGSQTVWEGKISAGNTYKYFGNKQSVQYIGEAADLKDFKDESYDFVVSSHCLEHCANVLKAVEEWVRVLKKNGALLLVLPDKRYTFDQYRPITSFEHLLEDYNKGIEENDMTHLPEILKLHDLSRDIPAGSSEEFRIRSLQNLHNRCLHHHVFNMDLLKKIIEH